METEQHPAILRNSVTSSGGTTASAIYELEKGGLRPLVNDAVWACYRRSLEMSGLSSAVGPRQTKHRVHYVETTPFNNNALPSGEMNKVVDDDSK